jgi:hypothetical protein
MTRTGVLTLVLALALAGGTRAQEPKPSEPAAEAPSLTGTWVMLLQGHQVGLEIEQKDTVLMGTLYIMGQRVPVDGEVADRTFTLASDSQIGDANSHVTVPIKITGTHKADDTLEGEIGMSRGPMKWTAERLKKP